MNQLHAIKKMLPHASDNDKVLLGVFDIQHLVVSRVLFKDPELKYITILIIHIQFKPSSGWKEVM